MTLKFCTCVYTNANLHEPVSIDDELSVTNQLN